MLPSFDHLETIPTLCLLNCAIYCPYACLSLCWLSYLSISTRAEENTEYSYGFHSRCHRYLLDSSVFEYGNCSSTVCIDICSSFIRTYAIHKDDGFFYPCTNTLDFTMVFCGLVCYMKLPTSTMFGVEMMAHQVLLFRANHKESCINGHDTAIYITEQQLPLASNLLSLFSL